MEHAQGFQGSRKRYADPRRPGAVQRLSCHSGKAEGNILVPRRRLRGDLLLEQRSQNCKTNMHTSEGLCSSVFGADAFLLITSISDDAVSFNGVPFKNRTSL